MKYRASVPTALLLVLTTGCGIAPISKQPTTRLDAPCYDMGNSYLVYLADDKRGHEVSVLRLIPEGILNRVIITADNRKPETTVINMVDITPTCELQSIMVDVGGITKFTYKFYSSGALKAFTIYEPHDKDAHAFKGKMLEYDEQGRFIKETEVTVEVVRT